MITQHHQAQIGSAISEPQRISEIQAELGRLKNAAANLVTRFDELEKRLSDATRSADAPPGAESAPTVAPRTTLGKHLSEITNVLDCLAGRMHDLETRVEL